MAFPTPCANCGYFGPGRVLVPDAGLLPCPHCNPKGMPPPDKSDDPLDKYDAALKKVIEDSKKAYGFTTTTTYTTSTSTNLPMTPGQKAILQAKQEARRKK